MVDCLFLSLYFWMLGALLYLTNALHTASHSNYSLGQTASMPSGLVDSKHNLPAVNIELIGDEGYPVLPGCIAAAALLLLVLVLGGVVVAGEGVVATLTGKGGVATLTGEGVVCCLVRVRPERSARIQG